MIRFVIAPFLPVGLLVAACLLGGWWSAAALISITALVMGLDRLPGPADSPAGTGHGVSVALGLAHLGLLPLGVWSLTHGAGGAQAGALALALGLYFGQVSNSNAHELIHRAGRWPRRLGVAVYASLLFGHHASAHRLVHHVHVATPDDPNSAPLGMSFWRFWPRAWIGSFRAGLAAERRRGRVMATYGVYVGGAGLGLIIAYVIGSWQAVLIWLALALYAQMQLLLSDYVQHYGLRRARRPDGGYAPAGPEHSWNAPHWYSSALMLNAPRHSDHHTAPARPFPDLRLNAGTMPMLPRSLPVMGAAALVPPLWRRMMDRRAARWSGETPPVTSRALGSAEAGLS
ncbi:MAG: alkane 1-monooxygenase [Paracoccaceae bacterium]|nr:alkane 1-monooxygenase [Paracoccaceae bacterium]